MSAPRISRALCPILFHKLPCPRPKRTLIRRSARHGAFHSSARCNAVKPYLLADIGEGITEVQIIQWFVQPGAKVAQFDRICEVQSDKAAVEITSRFDGVIKKLYYEADEHAKVGKPLVDIDIEGEANVELEAHTEPDTDAQPASSSTKPSPPSTALESSTNPNAPPSNQPPSSTRRNTLATPAVRHLSKELGIDIASVQGTGRDGRVMKEDLQWHSSSRSSQSQTTAKDESIVLAGIRKHMFKTMTASLAIPHFLYTDAIDFSRLTRFRRVVNSEVTSADHVAPRMSALAPIIKATSLAFSSHPSLNAHVDPEAQVLKHRGQHNIGFAVDTPQGLVVPVLRDVASMSIGVLANEISRLASLARANKLSQKDLSDATFTISNIGSIGGLAVSPIIVAPQVAILGIGRSRKVPYIGAEGLEEKEEAVFSWAADHRVVDGATVAHCSERVKWYLERPERMLTELR